VTDFGAGAYVVWAFRGRALVDISSIDGGDAMVSGVFLDSFTNTPPSVSLTVSTPSFQVPANLALEAAALNTDGQITNVDFFADGRKIGTCIAPPYTWDYRHPLAGKVLLSARACDNLGETASDSAEVAVTGASASAHFFGANEVAHGNWKGVFGSEGFNIIGDAEQYPPFLECWSSNAALHVWGYSPSERALQSALFDGRIAGAWFDHTRFEVSLNFRDEHFHLLSLYLLDWDSTRRREQVAFYDAQSGSLLDAREVADFHEGKYFSWIVRGHVAARFEAMSINTVVSGLFFDPRPATDFAIRAMVRSAAGNSRMALTWEASPNRRYRVQHCANLAESGWTDLTGDLVATTELLTAEFDVLGSPGQRFFRVLLSP